MEQHRLSLVHLYLTRAAAEAATTLEFPLLEGLEALEEVGRVIRMVLGTPGQQTQAVGAAAAVI
jgi:hypothetical protein